MILETIAIIKELVQSSCCCTTVDHHCLGDISHLTEEASDILKLSLVENDRIRCSTGIYKNISESIIDFFPIDYSAILDSISYSCNRISYSMHNVRFLIANPILSQYEIIHQAGRITVYGRNNAIMRY